MSRMTLIVRFMFLLRAFKLIPMPFTYQHPLTIQDANIHGSRRHTE